MPQKPGAQSTSKQTAVQSVVPCLVFKDQAEEAVSFYVSVFANSRIKSLLRSEMDGPIPKGKVIYAAFELNGREYTAFDGGEHFTFSDALSLVTICDTQQELDDVWRKLSSGGGREGPCGWVTDRFGLSWQVLPASLQRMLANPAGGNVRAVLEAVWKMGKLDAAALERAYRGA